MKCSAAKPSIPADLPSFVILLYLNQMAQHQYVHKQNSSSLCCGHCLAGQKNEFATCL